MRAAHEGKLEMATMLVDQGANLEAQDIVSNTTYMHCLHRMYYAYTVLLWKNTHTYICSYFLLDV